MTIFEKVAYWVFVFIIGGLIIYFIPNRHRIEFPTYQPKSQEHHEKLIAEGWKWCEGKGIYVRGNKVYPALYGGYFRKEHIIAIGLNNGSTFLKVSDPNTGEPIKLKYGENYLYPMLMWDDGQSICSFSVGDFSVNEDWDKSAWKDWNLPEEGNIALYGDREYHAILRHGPYDFPKADPNDYAKFLDKKITLYDGVREYDISRDAQITVR